MNTHMQPLFFLGLLLRSSRMPKDIKGPFNMHI